MKAATLYTTCFGVALKLQNGELKKEFESKIEGSSRVQTFKALNLSQNKRTLFDKVY